MNRYQIMCKEVADAIMAAGFIVYLSKNREYGFFTDAEEKVVVSFDGFTYCARFRGNYIASVRSQGSGWVIEDIAAIDPENIKKVFRAAHCPPAWATGNCTVTLTPVAHFLKMYQSSSVFTKLDCVGEE